jgi:hypothetical protein
MAAKVQPNASYQECLAGGSAGQVHNDAEVFWDSPFMGQDEYRSRPAAESAQPFDRQATDSAFVEHGGAGVAARQAGSSGLSRAEAELRRAAREVRAGLACLGESIQPSRIYVAQIDRKNRSRSDLGHLRGHTYVFKGGPNGTLEALGSFVSSSQPDVTGEDSKFQAGRERGAPHIRPGHYRVNRTWEKTYGGAFRIGTVPAARDLNRSGVIEPEEDATDESAGGILFHSAGYFSEGCQVIMDFARFARAVGQGRGSTFDYFLVRD